VFVLSFSSSTSASNQSHKLALFLATGNQPNTVPHFLLEFDPDTSLDPNLGKLVGSKKLRMVSNLWLYASPLPVRPKLVRHFTNEPKIVIQGIVQVASNHWEFGISIEGNPQEPYSVPKVRVVLDNSHAPVRNAQWSSSDFYTLGSATSSKPVAEFESVPEAAIPKVIESDLDSLSWERRVGDKILAEMLGSVSTTHPGLLSIESGSAQKIIFMNPSELENHIQDHFKDLASDRLRTSLKEFLLHAAEEYKAHFSNSGRPLFRFRDGKPLEGLDWLFYFFDVGIVLPEAKDARSMQYKLARLVFKIKPGHLSDQPEFDKFLRLSEPLGCADRLVTLLGR
jgi:hypothetical protein